MKIIKKDLKQRLIRVKVENKDDLWYLHKIIKRGDLISATTTRKIKKGNENIRKKIFVKIEADKNKFEDGNLRISGKIIECNDEDIPLGNYQSINIEENTIVTIEKENFLKRELNELSEASSKPYNILIAVFDREEALFYKVSKRGYEILSKIRGDVKKKDFEEHIKKSFFKDISEKLKKYNEEIKPETIIIASPSFWKEYLIKELDEGVKKKTISATCSSVGETAINEIIKRPETETALKKTRIKKEEEEIDKILKLISQNGKVAYGKEEVQKAVEFGAVKKLLTTTRKIEEDEEAEELIRKAEAQKAETSILDSEFEPGKQLDGLGGIAAELRFKIND